MKKSDYTPIQRLANAIIEQACSDYLEAKHKLHTVNYKNEENQRQVIGRYKKWLIEVPFFFESEHFKTLTDIDGKELLKMIEKQYILEVIESALKVANYCASATCNHCIFSKKRGHYFACILTNSSPEEEISELNTIYRDVKKNYGKTNTTNTTE